jgi:hypothetical protein
MTTTATSFPLSKHTGGGDTAPVFSGQSVYSQFTWKVCFPPSPLELSSHRHFYKLSRSWLLGMCCHSCLLWLACLFTVLWRIAPPPLFCAQGALPSLLCLFFVVIAYFSVFFSFSLGGSWSVQGAMLIWPRVVCGSTTCHLAHLVVCIFPSSLGTGVVGTGDLLVSPFIVEWECYEQAGDMEDQNFDCSSWFFL